MRPSIRFARSSSSLCSRPSSGGAGLWQRRPRQKRRKRFEDQLLRLVLRIRLEAGYCPPFFLRELAGGSPPLNGLDREINERIDRVMNGLTQIASSIFWAAAFSASNNSSAEILPF